MPEAVTGAGDGKNVVFQVATRTRRRGLKFGGTARSSGRHSLNSTMAAVQWDNSTYSNEVPLLMRFLSVTNGHRFTGEIGVEGSTATSRLTLGGTSLVFTSNAAATWGNWEAVSHNHYAKSEDGVQSHVLGYIGCTSSAQARIFYEVQTVPKVKV